VVAPSPSDLDIPEREAFAPKAAPSKQAKRIPVSGLYVRLHSVKTEFSEGATKHQRHPLGHVSLPCEGREGVIPKVRAPQIPEIDLADVDHSDEGAVFTPANEECGIVLSSPPP